MVTPLESLKQKYMKDPDIIPEEGQDKEKLVEALAQQQIRQRKNNDRAFELLTKAGSGQIADPGGGSKEGGDAAMYRLTEFVQKPVEKNDSLPAQWGDPTKKHLKIMNRPFNVIDKEDANKIELKPPPKYEGEIHEKELSELKSMQKLLDNEELVNRITAQDEKLMDPFKRYLRDNDLEIDSEEIAKINKDTSTIVHKFKFFYNRPRPHQVSDDIDEFENVAGKSPSYPSGHSTNTAVVAELLADKFPEHAETFRQMGREIGLNRVIAGLHYPTDHIAGLELAEQIIPLLIDKKITKSDEFMGELFKYMQHRAELLKDMTQIGTQDILDGVRISKAERKRRSVPSLTKKAKENLKKYGYENIKVADQKEWVSTKSNKDGSRNIIHPEAETDGTYEIIGNISPDGNTLKITEAAFRFEDEDLEKRIFITPNGKPVTGGGIKSGGMTEDMFGHDSKLYEGGVEKLISLEEQSNLEDMRRTSEAELDDTEGEITSKQRPAFNRFLKDIGYEYGDSLDTIQKKAIEEGTFTEGGENDIINYISAKLTHELEQAEIETNKKETKRKQASGKFSPVEDIDPIIRPYYDAIKDTYEDLITNKKTGKTAIDKGILKNKFVNFLVPKITDLQNNKNLGSLGDRFKKITAVLNDIRSKLDKNEDPIKMARPILVKATQDIIPTSIGGSAPDTPDSKEDLYQEIKKLKQEIDNLKDGTKDETKARKLIEKNQKLRDLLKELKAKDEEPKPKEKRSESKLKNEMIANFTEDDLAFYIGSKSIKDMIATQQKQLLTEGEIDKKNPWTLKTGEPYIYRHPLQSIFNSLPDEQKNKIKENLNLKIAELAKEEVPKDLTDNDLGEILKANKEFKKLADKFDSESKRKAKAEEKN